MALLGGVCLAFALTYPGGGRWDILAPYIIFGIALITSIGCGIFLAIMRITQEEGHAWITPKKIVFKTLSFCLLQIVISPFTAFATGLGCSAITSAF